MKTLTGLLVNKLIYLVKTTLEKENEAKLKEQMKREEKKKDLHRMLDENELFKLRQKEEAEKERLEDIKSMETYTKILDEQDQKRAAYFVSKAKKQDERIQMMLDTVIKEQEQKAKLEEERTRRYQMEKDRKDQEEEDRRKQRIKDSKSHMRDYLTSQMKDKVIRGKSEKEKEYQAMQEWCAMDRDQLLKEQERDRNRLRAEKENEKRIKDQIEGKSKGRYQAMTDEEYKYNKEILDEIAQSGMEPTKERKFLI